LKKEKAKMDMSYNTLEDLDIGVFQELDQFVQNFDKVVENFIRLKIYKDVTKRKP
jgi:hypothetical protein